MILDALQEHEPRSMQSYFPIVWKHAKNDIITDMYNKKYIDFTSTIFVMNVGHSNKQVKKNIKRCLNDNLLHTYIYAHKYRAEFLNIFSRILPLYLEKTFLLSSGTEATEAAIKLMRLYGRKFNRNKIVSFRGAMHGRTMGAELLKGSNYWKHEDFIHLDFNGDIEILQKNKDNICGIIIETYQGWSAKFLNKEYVKKLYDFAKKNNILICFDEIQSGFYRTGELFGYMHYEVEPDLVCIGKAIGGGLPLSAVLGKKEIIDIPEAGEMSSTHSANPLCCSAGIGVVEEIINKDFKKMSKDKGLIIENKLNEIKTKYNIVKEINHKGMVAGIIFDNENMATQICRNALAKGLLLVHTHRESIKIGPPITITTKNLIKGLNILESAINDYKN